MNWQVGLSIYYRNLKFADRDLLRSSYLDWLDLGAIIDQRLPSHCRPELVPAEFLRVGITYNTIRPHMGIHGICSTSSYDRTFATAGRP